MQAVDRVDIATVLAADEDFELRIDGAGVSDEAADHLDDWMWGWMGEVVGTEGSEAIDGVNVIVIACNFGAQGGDDFAAGDGGCRGFDHRAECIRNCEALFFL